MNVSNDQMRIDRDSTSRGGDALRSEWSALGGFPFSLCNLMAQAGNEEKELPRLGVAESLEVVFELGHNCNAGEVRVSRDPAPSRDVSVQLTAALPARS